MYNYSTPEQAILSLERAYTNRDLEAVTDSIDFHFEAILVLKKTGYDLSDDLIEETSKLLKLSLIKNIQDNGFPDFTGVSNQFSNIEKTEEGFYSIKERLNYPDGYVNLNLIYLSFKNNNWKVITVIEQSPVVGNGAD